MKILLAVDGSAYTKHMLAYLAAHEELLGTDRVLTFLTVVPPVPAYATHYIPRESINDYYAEQGEAILAPVRAFAAHHGWLATTQHAIGNASEVIARTASEGRYDLLVLGSHGHSALGTLVLGSVATGVIARCDTPTLIVRGHTGA